MNLSDKIRAVLSPERRKQLEDREADMQFPVNERARRRYEERYRERRRVKGNRRFFEQQRKYQFQQDTIRMQLHVLKTREPGDPMYQNVYNGLVAKYGPQIDAMIEAEKTGIAA